MSTISTLLVDYFFCIIFNIISLIKIWKTCFKRPYAENISEPLEMIYRFYCIYYYDGFPEGHLQN